MIYYLNIQDIQVDL